MRQPWLVQTQCQKLSPWLGGSQGLPPAGLTFQLWHRLASPCTTSRTLFCCLLTIWGSYMQACSSEVTGSSIWMWACFFGLDLVSTHKSVLQNYTAILQMKECKPFSISRQQACIKKPVESLCQLLICKTSSSAKRHAAEVTDEAELVYMHDT